MDRARGRWLLHGIALAGLLLDAALGGASGTAPAPLPAHAAPGTVTLTAADPADSALRYRVVTGADGPVVEASADGGAHWAAILTSGFAEQAAAQTPIAVAIGAGCRPARYVAVNVLRPVASTIAGAPVLYIGTEGATGLYLDYGCGSAVGGVFARQPDGSVTPLGVAGLPYDQDPAGRTIRAYDVDMVTPDPTSSAVLYVHASHGYGPGSPPEGLYRSTDAGQHWAEIDSGIRPSAVITNSVGLAVPVYGPGTLAISTGQPQRLTWVTDTGAYVSDDGGTTWRPATGANVSPRPLPTSTPAGAGTITTEARRHGGNTEPLVLCQASSGQLNRPQSAGSCHQGTRDRGTRVRVAAVAGPRAVSGPLMPGLDEGWSVNKGAPLVTPGQIANTQRAGARYVRVNFRLGGAQSWSDTATLNAYDTVVNNYLANGIQVLGLVTSEATTDGKQSDWTANNYENTGGSGDNPFISSAYVQGALVPLIQHFHDRVKLWELWNEPNASHSCSGSVCTGGTFIYPSNFAALLADAYGAIKPSYPDVTLISGGIFAHDIGGQVTPNNAGVTYLQNTFTMGTSVTGAWQPFMSAGGAFPYPLDAIGQHLYLDQGGLTTSDHISSYYTWLHQAPLPFVTPQPGQPNAAALPATDMTEGAWSTANVTQDIQAQNLDILYSTSRGMGFVPLVVWFELQDNVAANLYFGLIDRNGNDKESFSHYQAQATAAAGGQSAVLSAGSGWTLISLPLIPASGTLYASTLLQGLLQSSGGSLAAIYALSNGAWSSPLIIQGGAQTGTDFALQPGQGYLLYMDAPGQYTETGSAPSGQFTWTLGAGWNLVGVAAPVAASTVLSGILSASGNTGLAAIYALSNGAWSAPLIDQGGTQTGMPFTLQPGQGYLLYTQQGLTYTPGATAASGS